MIYIDLFSPYRHLIQLSSCCTHISNDSLFVSQVSAIIDQVSVDVKFKGWNACFLFFYLFAKKKEQGRGGARESRGVLGQSSVLIVCCEM